MERAIHSHFHFVLGTELDLWHTHEHNCPENGIFSTGNGDFNVLHHHAPLEHDNFPLEKLETVDRYTVHSWND